MVTAAALVVCAVAAVVPAQACSGAQPARRHSGAASPRRSSVPNGAHPTPPPVPAGLGPPFTVASKTITLFDPSRRTPARGSVPSSPGRRLVTDLLVPSGAPGPLPLIVFAHGWNSDPGFYAPLLHEWSEAGFLVAAPVFPDSTDLAAGSPVSDYAEQALDLSFVISSLLHDDIASVDPTRIAVAGHSDGGTDVALLALDPAYADPRVRAYVCLAGELPSGVAPYAFGASRGALLVAVGSNDEYGLAARSPVVFQDAVTSSKAMIVEQGGDHLGSFVSSTPAAAAMREEITKFLELSLEPRTPSTAAILAALALTGSPQLTVVAPP